MTTLYALLVGSHFRPPAKCVLSSLPSGTSLTLRPEPENPYDSEAVAVYLSPREIPESAHESLSRELPSFGSSLDELLSQEEPLHLGYLARESNKDLKKRAESTGLELQTAAEVLQIDHVRAPFGKIENLAEASLLWGPNGESLIKIE